MTDSVNEVPAGCGNLGGNLAQAEAQEGFLEAVVPKLGVQGGREAMRCNGVRFWRSRVGRRWARARRASGVGRPLAAAPRAVRTARLAGARSLQVLGRRLRFQQGAAGLGVWPGR